MIRVIIAPPNVDVTKAYKGIDPQSEDPVRRKCEELGFQTIYDIPLSQQLQVREALLDDHLSFLKSVRGDLTLPYSVFGWLADWMRWAWSTVPTERWEQVCKKGRACADLYGEIAVLRQGPVLSYDGYTWLDSRNSESILKLSLYLVEEFGQQKKLKS